MAEFDEYTVDVAHVSGAHGVQGHVKIVCYSDMADRMHTVHQVCIRPEVGAAFLSSVLEARQVPHRSVYIVRLAGVENRDDAIALAGAAMSIVPDQSPELPESSYYVADIIGLQVVTHEGQALGSIVEIIRTGANDVYQLDSGLLVPAIAQVIRDVDLNTGVMVITPLPGMLE